MMSQVGNVGEDPEEAAPSVDSENPEERTAARRIRVAARNEVKKRQELGGEKKEIKVEMRKSQHQVEERDKRVAKLRGDGTELVTNIQTRGDMRESQRRAEKEEARRLRMEKLESEAKSSLEKFEEITSRWAVAKRKEIPQDLKDSLDSQQQLCALLIQDKNKLINELQQELKARDDRYVKDLKQQAEDIDLMIERMEAQVKSLLKTYREELDKIEKAYDDERQVLLTGNRKKWEQHMEERRDKELENLTQRMRKVEEHEALLRQLRVDDSEEYKKIKIQLDTDVQVLEQQLQQMKATYQLNQEKLEYNLHVLKKRDEENTITKSQQKRKITRLQDALNNLKIRCSRQEKQSKQENLGLTEDCRRNVQQYNHLQKKMRHFAAIDAKRFEEVWLMNEAEVRVLAEKALDIDRLLHQQQLGVAWERPSLAFMERSGPVQPQRQAARTARQAASELLRSSPGTREAAAGPGALVDAGAGPGGESPGLAVEVDAGGVGSQSREEEEEGGGEEQGEVSVKTVKKLLELLCDEAGFLIETKFLKLLSPLEKDDRSLIKLDSIFSAMGMESEEDVYKLADFFVKYKQQQGDQAEEVSVDSEERSGPTPTSDLIHPNDLLVALRAFTSQHHPHREATALQRSSVLGLGGLDAAYWEAIANVIPESKLKIWDALESSLPKYHSVLTERSKLITDTQSLKQQNTELRMLLHQYLNSRVNAELEIPPTHLMQLTPE